MSFQDKVAFITGGSSGIGEATAKRLAEMGAKVAIVARDKDELKQATKEMESKGGTVMPLSLDVSDSNKVQAAYELVVKEWGQLDYVFANAGINGVWAPLDELDVEEWQQTIDINLSGTFYTIKFAVPHMSVGSSIVVTASVNGTRMFSNTGATAYSVSKAGQAAMVKMLALELAPQGIRVNVVCPGKIETEIEENTERQHLERVRYPVEYPQGKVPLTRGKGGSSDDVAKLVTFLMSDDARHITGTEVWIDGAESLLVG
jgi:NAD(P)-dependent dehydrogenase (short-subunit alcohol dehydrogenase family)